MEQEELRRFFGEVLKDEGYVSSESFAVFGKLVRLTIDYRDHLLADQNLTLTVEDTKKGIGLYLEALKSGHLPEEIEPRIAGLVRLWLKEINDLRY